MAFLRCVYASVCVDFSFREAMESCMKRKDLKQMVLCSQKSQGIQVNPDFVLSCK